MTINTYHAGQSVTLSSTFREESLGLLFNPATVTVEVRSPRGITTSYEYGVDDEVEHPSSGVYEITLYPDVAGRWTYRWRGVQDDTTPTRHGFFDVVVAI